MLKQIGIVGLLFISQMGCSAQSPSWLDKPVNDTAQAFVQAGSGDNEQAAIRDALTRLSSRLIVNVENETRTQVQKEQDEVTSRYQSDSRFLTESLDFVKVETVKTHKENGRFHVLITADKGQLFAAIEEKLEADLLPLLKVSDENPGQMLANGIKLESQLPKYRKYLSLLQAYDQNTAHIAGPYRIFMHQYQALKTNTSFSVVATEPKFNLGTKLATKLNQAGYFQGSKASHLEAILVGPELQQANINGFQGIKATGSVVYSLNGQMILTQPLEAFEFDKDPNQAMSNLTQTLHALIDQGQ